MKSIKKIGQAPGTVSFVGEKKVEEVKLSLIIMNEGASTINHSVSLDDCFPLEQDKIYWLKVVGLHNVAFIEEIGKRMGIHSLVLEDIVNTDHRPKLDVMDDYYFLVLKSIDYDIIQKKIVEEQVSLILGKNFILSFEESEPELFDNVIARIQNGQHRINKKGADFLFYNLLDAIIDHYFEVLNSLEDEVNTLEDELMVNPSIDILSEMSRLKRNLLVFFKSMYPIRDIARKLEQERSGLIKDETNIYFLDLYDHAVQIASSIETLREMTVSMLDIYHSSVSNKLNEIMKILTIISTIFIPLTFLVGVYGMNFKHMPELEWKTGYFLLWFVMLSIAVSMMFFFKRKKWF